MLQLPTNAYGDFKSHRPIWKRLPTGTQRATCFENVQERTREKRGKRKKKVCPTPRAREVTGTTPNPRAVPMETSVAAYNEGERVMKERESGKGQGEEGGLLASRFSWWVLGESVGAAPL